MRNIRYILRLFAAFISRFKVILGIGIFLGIVIFLLFNYLFPVITGWQVTRIGITGRYSVNSLPNTVLEKISSGLTAMDASAKVQPALATSWSTADKGVTWIFKLDGKGKWQDGTTVKASDINYHFSDVTVKYPDDKTIEFTLQNPYSAFPSVVSKPVFKEGLLGTGDWQVKHLTLAGEFVNQLTIENSAKKRIIYKFYPTEESVKLAFELGQVDSIIDLLDPAPIDKWKLAKVTKTTDKGEYVGVFFNLSDKLLADKSLRQALSYATQKENLGGVRAIGPVSDTSWAFNPQVKPYAYDAEKAKGMIKAMDPSIKDNLDITLTTSAFLLPQAELIQADWENIGVKTKIQVISTIPTNYQALLAIFDSPDDPDQYSIWHSTQTETNITHYSNQRIDKLLEVGRTTLEEVDRKQTYFDFQRFLLEDPPAIFLYYPTKYTISRY